MMICELEYICLIHDAPAFKDVAHLTVRYYKVNVTNIRFISYTITVSNCNNQIGVKKYCVAPLCGRSGSDESAISFKSNIESNILEISNTNRISNTN